MKALANLLTSIIVAVWVVAIAILSVQNATLVSLRFLNFQSIQLPMGLVLAFSAGVGLIAVALILPLWGAPSRSNNNIDDDFSFDE